MVKLINFIFFFIKIKKRIKEKTNKNSPLVKINKPETIEKIKMFLLIGLPITKNKNFKNNREKTICKVIEEICPQIITFTGIIEKITELINDSLFDKTNK